MFPLLERKVVGFKHGTRRWSVPYLGKPHPGVDYKASFVPLYAPFDGKIVKQLKGTDGGYTIWFVPNHRYVTIRFLHLDHFTRGLGPVREGEQIAITGNSGAVTTGPHIHMDISNGAVNLKNFANFIDPESFDWGTQKPVEQPVNENEYPKKVKITEPAGVFVRERPDHNSPIVNPYTHKPETRPLTRAVINQIKLKPGEEYWVIGEREGSTPPNFDGSKIWLESKYHNFFFKKTTE